MSLIKSNTDHRESEKMSDQMFRFMNLTFVITDFFFPYIDKRVVDFGIREGMTVVDYGCGPGRYTTCFAKMVGKAGKVYAADIHEIAIDMVKRKMARHHLENIHPVLVNGYNSAIPDQTANVVCALDMFFAIKNPSEFLKEIKRITRPDGVLIIDDGHQPRAETIQKILASGYWSIWQETKDHLKCKPA